MTFIVDRIVRNDKGHPIGRCSFKVRFQYTTGMQEIPVALCEFPKVYVKDPRGMTFYIDGFAYTLSKDIHDIRVNKSDPTKVIVNNVSFIRV